MMDDDEFEGDLRDFFAAHAMQGLIAGGFAKGLTKELCARLAEDVDEYEVLASVAYTFAGAMMETRNALREEGEE